MARLTGKRIVITGSSRSLGRHFALACAAEGASLIINGTNEQALAKVAREVADLGVAVHAVVGSVAEAEVCNALVDTCVDKFGGIDVMVNNAGIVRDRTLVKMSDEDFDEANYQSSGYGSDFASVAEHAQNTKLQVQVCLNCAPSG